jgi:hypothetical protein
MRSNFVGNNLYDLIPGSDFTSHTMNQTKQTTVQTNMFHDITVAACSVAVQRLA